MTKLEYLIAELQCASRDHDPYEAAKIISEAYLDSCVKNAYECRSDNCIICLARYLDKRVKEKRS